MPEGLFSAWGAGPFASYSRKKKKGITITGRALGARYGARSWGAAWGAAWGAFSGLGRGMGRALGARHGARSWDATWGGLLGLSGTLHTVSKTRLSPE